MRLLYSPASPYVRKVLVLARERRLADRIELVACQPDPVRRNPTIAEHNPTGKIPTLLLADGTALYDSRVICEYLDSLHPGEPLIPPPGQARWTTLTLQALADGLLDAAVLGRYESAVRPQAQQWPAWLDAQKAKILASAGELSRHWMAHLQRRMDLGCIAAGCALGYLDFRYPDLEWRQDNAALAEWFAAFSRRPSMQATAPPAS